MTSRIEQIIEEIEEYVDSCKPQPLSSTKIIVNREELLELLRELRMKTPDEIKRYQKIISNKDAILADAQAKADSLISDATAHTNEMISESEIVQQAYAQANEVLDSAQRQAQEVLDSATEDANNIRYSAIKYTDDMLANLEEIMGHTIETAGVKYNNFINSIQSCYDIVNKNRSELMPGRTTTPSTSETQGTSTEEEYTED